MVSDARRKRVRMKTSFSSKLFDVFNYGFLVFLGLITLYPFIFITALAFNDGLDTLRGGIWLYPRSLTLVNFAEAFKNDYIVNAFFITLSRTLAGTVISVILTALLAYAISDRNMKGSRFITVYIFISTLFSGGIIPYFILMRDLRLLDNYFMYIVPVLYNFYNMIIIRAAFSAIPKSLEESCRIDGAGDFRILFTVYMPLSMPALATIALFVGVFHWNDWFAGAFFISDKMLKPAATLLQEIINNAASDNPDMMNTALGQAAIRSTPQSLQMAFVVILVFPIVCVYPFLQKYFIKGVMIGSIKE